MGIGIGTDWELGTAYAHPSRFPTSPELQSFKLDKRQLGGVPRCGAQNKVCVYKCQQHLLRILYIKQEMPRKYMTVVFDTNAVWQDQSPVHLFRKEVSDLLKEGKTFVDLELNWLIPDLVRKERECQLHKLAVEKLLKPISHIETLTGNPLNLDSAALLLRVKSLIIKQATTLGVKFVPLKTEDVDWPMLLDAACTRCAPFSTEGEKGFKDAMIAETFYQIVSDTSQHLPDSRIVLIAKDSLLCQAVSERLKGHKQVEVLPSVSELRSLLNTLSSQFNEAQMTALRKEAEKLFYGEDSSLWNTAQLPALLFAKAMLPPVDAGVSIESEAPTFLKKDGRLYWASRVSLVHTATSIDYEKISRYRHELRASLGPPDPLFERYDPITSSVQFAQTMHLWPQPLMSHFDDSPIRQQNLIPWIYKRIQVTTKFDVLWSTEYCDGIQSDPQHSEIRYVDASYLEMPSYQY